MSRGRPRSDRPTTVLVYYPDREQAQRYGSLVRAPRGRITLHVGWDPEQAVRIIGDVDVMYAWKFPPSLYPGAPRLRWLQGMGAGVDWALVPELPARVTVTRAPGVFGPWMSEYVLARCLAVTQRIDHYRQAQRDRRWIEEQIPERLAGKTLAMVGLGDVGRVIARAARAAGMRVIGVTRAGRPVAGVERVWRVGNMRRALAEADFVVLAIPLTRDTRGLIGAAELAAMKPTAWLINVARGPVIDEGALVPALRARRIGGAVLDVFTEEPLPPAHPLWGLDNAVVTPHISGPSTPEELTPLFNDNLARFLAGRPLRHVVNRKKGY